MSHDTICQALSLFSVVQVQSIVQCSKRDTVRWLWEATVHDVTDNFGTIIQIHKNTLPMYIIYIHKFIVLVCLSSLLDHKIHGLVS